MKALFGLTYLFAVAAAVLQIVSAEDQVLKAPGGEDVYVKLMGLGGQLLLSDSEDFLDNNTIVIRLTRLIESGRVAGSDEMIDFTTQTFNFADREFSLSPVQDDVNFPNTSYKVNEISLGTNLTAGNQDIIIGTVTLNVYIFQDESLLDMDGELVVMLPGTVKFNIQVDNYDFCSVGVGDCEGDGEVLKVEFEVKGKGDGKIEKAEKRREGDSVDAYHTGGTSAMRISNKVQVDGEWQDLSTPAEFKSENSKTRMVLNLPKFQNSVLYDPTLDLNIDGIGSASVGVDGNVGVDEEGVNVGLDDAHAGVTVGDNSAGNIKVITSLFIVALIARALL